MIDIHNHIIFDVDDGSKSLDQSIEMIKAAKESGFDEICFTPHYMEDGYRTERAVLEKKVEIIKKAVKREKIDIKIHLGEEIFIFPTLPANLDKVISLNDSKYLLIEFPLVEKINYIDDVLYELMTLDKIPIIAHPERYLETEKNYSMIEELAQRGVLFQSNINSIVGHYGSAAKKLVIKLLKDNLIQFIGSDAHSVAGYKKASESLKALKKLVGEEKLKEMTEINPKLVLENKEIEIDHVTSTKKHGNQFFSSFWKRM